MATDHRGNIVGNPMTGHGGHRSTPRIPRTMTEAVKGVMPVTTTNTGRSTHEYDSKIAKAYVRMRKWQADDIATHGAPGRYYMLEDHTTGDVSTMHENEYLLASANDEKIPYGGIDIWEERKDD